MSIYAGGHGYLDDIPVGDVVRFRTELLDFLRASKPGDLRCTSCKEQKFTEAIEAELNAAIEYVQAAVLGDGLRQVDHAQPSRHRTAYQLRRIDEADHAHHGNGRRRQDPPRHRARGGRDAVFRLHDGDARERRRARGRHRKTRLLQTHDEVRRVLRGGRCVGPWPCRRLQQQRAAPCRATDEAKAGPRMRRWTSWPAARRPSGTSTTASIEPALRVHRTFLPTRRSRKRRQIAAYAIDGYEKGKLDEVIRACTTTRRTPPSSGSARSRCCPSDTVPRCWRSLLQDAEAATPGASRATWMFEPSAERACSTGCCRPTCARTLYHGAHRLGVRPSRARAATR